MGMPNAEQNIADDEAARIAAMQRAANRGGALGSGIAPANSPGGENPGGVNYMTPNGPLSASQATSPSGSGSTDFAGSTTGIGGLRPAGDTAIQRAAAVASATASGPPVPNFTGTFGGKQYSGGQLVTSGPTSVSPSATPVNPTTAAQSGSLGPTSVPTGNSGGGSLAPALTPRPAAPTGPTSVSPTSTDTGAISRALTTDGAQQGLTQTAQAGAGTANLNGPQMADKAIVNGVEVWAGGPNAGQPTATTSGELVPAGGAPGGGDLGAITSGVMQQLQQIQQSLAGPGASTDVTATYMKSAQSILAMLDQQEAQLKAENEKAGTSIDPATQFTIDKLRETLDTNLKTMKEDLNRRGLSDSGIQLELENRLTKGSASDQAGILADRLSKLQDQLQQGLTNIRSQKYSTANSYGLAAANAQSSWDDNSRKLAADREQNALQGMLNLRGQVSTAENARLSEIAASGRASASDTAAMARALVGEQGANSRNAASIAGTATQDEANRQNAIRLEQMRNAASAADRASSTAGQNTTQLANTQSAINDMKNTYSSQEEANAAINANIAILEPKIGAAGIAAMRAAAASLPHRTGGTTSSAAGTGASRGSSRLE